MFTKVLLARISVTLLAQSVSLNKIPSRQISRQPESSHTHVLLLSSSSPIAAVVLGAGDVQAENWAHGHRKIYFAGAKKYL